MSSFRAASRQPSRLPRRGGGGAVADDRDRDDLPHKFTATPIKHLVVIFQENVSFDHYFGTYPSAQNNAGEPAFHARANTPTVNGLSPALLTKNPNLNPANLTGATNPFRLDRSDRKSTRL